MRNFLLTVSHLDSELIETLSRSTSNEDRSSDGQAVSFISPVFQLVLSRLDMFLVTRKKGGGGGYKCRKIIHKGLFQGFIFIYASSFMAKSLLDLLTIGIEEDCHKRL